MSKGAGKHHKHYTRQFRGCKQAGQRAVAPDESPNDIRTECELEEKHEGRFFGTLSHMAGLKIPLNYEGLVV